LDAAEITNVHKVGVGEVGDVVRERRKSKATPRFRTSEVKAGFPELEAYCRLLGETLILGVWGVTTTRFGLGAGLWGPHEILYLMMFRNMK